MESARLRRIDSNRSPAQALVQVSKSRPRASGGHPDPAAVATGAGVSSPRERGSSYRRSPMGTPSMVVPARAGVIHKGRASSREGVWSSVVGGG